MRTRSLIGRDVVVLVLVVGPRPGRTGWPRRTDALGRDGSEPYLSLGVGCSGVPGASVAGLDGIYADVRCVEA